MNQSNSSKKTHVLFYATDGCDMGEKYVAGVTQDEELAAKWSTFGRQLTLLLMLRINPNVTPRLQQYVSKKLPEVQRPFALLVSQNRLVEEIEFWLEFRKERSSFRPRGDVPLETWAEEMPMLS